MGDNIIPLKYNKSKEAFKHNVKVEMQALAIAYSIKIGGYMEVVDKSFELEELRHRRAQECFPIINRGYPWYSTLNNDQKLELKNWYFAWLDVTETRNIPKKPEWLNKKIEKEEILL